MKKNLFLFFGTTVVCLLAADLALRFVSPPIPYGYGSFRGPKSRLYGWAPFPNRTYSFTHPDTGEVSHYQTNSQGWKDVEHPLQKPPGVVRILFIGDSVTWGTVHLRDIYTRKVENLLRAQGFANTEVISIGAIAWGTDQALEVLRGEGVDYHPDFVVYQFTVNDVIDNLLPNELTGPTHLAWKKPFRYQLANGDLEKTRWEKSTKRKVKDALLRSALVYNLNIVRNKVAARLRPPVRRRMARMHIFNPLSDYFLYRPATDPPKVREAWGFFEALVVRMKEVAEGHGARFAVFTIAGEKSKRRTDFKKYIYQTDGGAYYVEKDGKRYPVDNKRPLKNI
jgi:hypothetical protein